jgi:hypothetical protein
MTSAVSVSAHLFPRIGITAVIIACAAGIQPPPFRRISFLSLFCDPCCVVDKGSQFISVGSSNHPLAQARIAQ